MVAVKSQKILKDLANYKINLQIIKGDELEIFSKIKNDNVSIY